MTKVYHRVMFSTRHHLLLLQLTDPSNGRGWPDHGIWGLHLLVLIILGSFRLIFEQPTLVLFDCVQLAEWVILHQPADIFFYALRRAFVNQYELHVGCGCDVGAGMLFRTLFQLRQFRTLNHGRFRYLADATINIERHRCWIYVLYTTANFLFLNHY